MIAGVHFALIVSIVVVLSWVSRNVAVAPRRLFGTLFLNGDIASIVRRTRINIKILR